MDSENSKSELTLSNVEKDPLSLGRNHGYTQGAGVSNYNLPANDNGLLQYWPILRKHRWTVLATIIIVVTLTTVITMRTTPIYEAVGRIAVNHENNDVLGFKSAGDSLNPDYDWDYAVALDTQIKIL